MPSSQNINKSPTHPGKMIFRQLNFPVTMFIVEAGCRMPLTHLTRKATGVQFLAEVKYFILTSWPDQL
jgi:hypothetical protein